MKNKTVTAQKLIDAGLPRAIFWNNDLSKEVPSDIFIIATLKRSYNDFIIEKFIEYFGENYLLSTLLKHKSKLSNTLLNIVIDRINNLSNFRIDIDKKNILFVYGSLKKGFDNHNILLQDSQYLGKAITVDKFGMFQDTFGNYPYLISVPIMQIYGELYEIKSTALWKKLDEFEGVPNYYDRKIITVSLDGDIYNSFVYIQPHTDVPKDKEPINNWIQ